MSNFMRIVNESNNSFSKDSNIFFSEDDIYCNFDTFEKKKVHFCFVTGLSGSGKTTLAKKLAKKYKAHYVELDILMYASARKPLTKDFLKKVDQPLISKWIDMTNQNLAYSQNPDSFEKGVDFRIQKTCEFIEWLININKERCIIEGIDLTRIFPYKQSWNNYPCVFKGTSKMKSMYRRFQREDSLNDMKITDIIGYLFKTNYWYSQHKADLDAMRYGVIKRDGSNTITKSE